MPVRAEVEKPAPEPLRSGSAAPVPRADAAEATVRVRRYLRFLGCEPALADDCAQDALVAAVQQYGGALPPLPWLLTAARNAFRMHLRKQGRLQQCDDLDALHADWVAVAGDDAGDERLVALRACLQELPPRSRRALDLRYADGADRRAIGSELGLGDEGVKSMLERLRIALAACVQRRLRS